MEINFSLLDPDLGEKMNADPYGSAAQQLRFIYLVDQLGHHRRTVDRVDDDRTLGSGALARHQLFSFFAP